jgi:hypothetical protein
MAGILPTEPRMIDLDSYDPAKHFRSKISKLQRQISSEDIKPTILTKIINAIDPFNPECENFIDEAQIAIRRVAHLHDRRCYVDPSVHEVDPLETGYAPPLYEIHTITQPIDWAQRIRTLIDMSDNGNPRLGFESVEARDAWLETAGSTDTVSQIQESEPSFELPGLMRSPETEHLEFRISENVFNHTRYAEWTRLSVPVRSKRIIDWINANSEASTHSFYAGYQLWGDNIPLQRRNGFIVVNSKQVGDKSRRFNEIFNTLTGGDDVVKFKTGPAVPEYRRYGFGLPGLEADSRLVLLGFDDRYANFGAQIYPHESFLREHSDSDSIGTYASAADLHPRNRLDSEKWEGIQRAKSRTPERRSLLLLIMRELCIIVHHWARVRTAADEVVDCFANDQNEERRIRNVRALVEEYTRNDYVDYVQTVKKACYQLPIQVSPTDDK